MNTKNQPPEPLQKDVPTADEKPIVFCIKCGSSLLEDACTRCLPETK